METFQRQQFSLQQLITGFILISVGMGLIASGWFPGISLGIAILAGIASHLIANTFFYFSDRIDNRPLNDRNWSSRVVNGIGLLVFIIAYLAVISLAVLFVIQFSFWVIDHLVPTKLVT